MAELDPILTSIVNDMVDANFWRADQEPITPEALEADGWKHHPTSGAWTKSGFDLWPAYGGWHDSDANYRPRTMGHLRALLEMCE